MWYRVVCYCGTDSDWEPMWALCQRGDGPLLPKFGSLQPLLFKTLRDVVEWAKDRDNGVRFLELPAQTIIKG